MVDYNNLIDGPDVDGKPTWFAVGARVPKGWEARFGIAAPWKTDHLLANTWYQVRPVQLDDPVTLAYGAELGVPPSRIVLWKEMKDRPDLDQWEWLRGDGRWTKLPTQGAVTNDGWPLRVRRRQTEPEPSSEAEAKIRDRLRKETPLSLSDIDDVIDVLVGEGLLE